jgi:hypothetical protein
LTNPVSGFAQQQDIFLTFYLSQCDRFFSINAIACNNSVSEVVEPFSHWCLRLTWGISDRWIAGS